MPFFSVIKNYNSLQEVLGPVALFHVSGNQLVILWYEGADQQQGTGSAGLEKAFGWIAESLRVQLGKGKLLRISGSRNP